MIDARAFNYVDRGATGKKLIPKAHEELIEIVPEDLLGTVRRMQGQDVAYVVIGAGKTVRLAIGILHQAAPPLGDRCGLPLASFPGRPSPLW